ncbi:MAG: matrixin family metalloprotease [Chloroflexota bacterium]
MKYPSYNGLISHYWLIIITISTIGFIWSHQSTQATQRRAQLNQNNAILHAISVGPRLFELSIAPHALLPPLSKTIRFHTHIHENEQAIYLVSGTAEDEMNLQAAGLAVSTVGERVDGQQYFLLMAEEGGRPDEGSLLSEYGLSLWKKGPYIAVAVQTQHVIELTQSWDNASIDYIPLIDAQVQGPRFPVPAISHATSTLPGCTELMTNGGFELDSGWGYGDTPSPARIVTEPVYDGVRALGLGIPTSGTNRLSHSTAYRYIEVPSAALSVQLTIWMQTHGDSDGRDFRDITLIDSYYGIQDQLFKEGGVGTEEWTRHTFDLSEYRGRTVILFLNVYNNGTGSQMWSYVDHISLVACDSPPTATPVPTNTPVSTASPTATETPTLTQTSIPSHTATSTFTRQPTSTASPTETTTQIPSSTPTSTGTATWTATLTPTPSPSLTFTLSPTPSPTITITPTPTNEASNTPTLTPSSTQTSTPTPENAALRLRAADVDAIGQTTLAVPILIEQIPASMLVGGILVNLLYDATVLRVDDCSPESGARFLLVCNPLEEGIIRVAVADASGIMTDTLLAEIPFSLVQENQVLPSVTKVQVQSVSVESVDGEGLQVHAQHSHIRLNCLMGDVDCDGERSSTDAQQILQHSVGLIGERERLPLSADTIYTPACDVSGDDQCGAEDALMVWQCAAGFGNNLCDNRLEQGTTTSTWPEPSAPEASIPETRETVSIEIEQLPANLRAPATISVMKRGAVTLGAATIEVTYDPTRLRLIRCLANVAGQLTEHACNVAYDQTEAMFTIVRIGVVLPAGMTHHGELAALTFEPISMESERVDGSANEDTMPEDLQPSLRVISLTDVTGNSLLSRIVEDENELKRLFLPVIVPLPHPVFSPDTTEEYIQKFHQHFANPIRIEPFELSARWLTHKTATGSGGDNQGDAITLTWSIIPDGTMMQKGYFDKSGCYSNLIGKLNAIYGADKWQAEIEKVFDHWDAKSGIVYVQENGANGNGIDDGARWPNSHGAKGIRGDIRIGGCLIDGEGEANGNILAYSFYPSAGGDMKIDSEDPFLENSEILKTHFHNMIAHEQGHGIGLDHVCPMDDAKLMEPRLSNEFVGLQHDDIRSVQRLYGDRYETINGSNDSSALATELGRLSLGDSIILKDLSIDDENDTDWFEFTAETNLYTAPSENQSLRSTVEVAESSSFQSDRSMAVDIQVIPAGKEYRRGPQASNGACSEGMLVDSLRVHDLKVELIDGDGVTVLAKGDAQPVGQIEQLNDVKLERADRTYLRISGDQTDDIQLYTLVITAKDGQTEPKPPVPGDDPVHSVCTSGDVNCDEERTVTDALYILQYIEALRQGTDALPLPSGAFYIPACDVNSDSACTEVDALLVLQCTVQIENTLCPAVPPDHH